ncbi:class A beta-lactamase-related serine hydrolase [Streptomyces nitrosporeus]|uniref:Class A beta-lactamase-related serine hydrolase n=1 Tax=Streptomyces nitrosporeus TaxID=28894 RepID=A0A5J6FJZ9_9ACTN|nr:serine hydrolase domain-containing protein [Streptomyces nitrosporeus]QEU75250.1 class A beta-lactamase-related serine hydrolase [Streptomyces nitrosporeus]
MPSDLRRTAALCAAALLATLVPPAASAGAAGRPAASLRQATDALHATGVTGVSARLETGRTVTTARSGTGDLRTGRPVPRDAYIRIGSTTKTFVATVVLQLADERRLSLDDTVERWLPGVVRGQGNDGRRVTLRQLLQHTSGVPDYTGDALPDPTAAGYHEHRLTAYSSLRRVQLAMGHPPAFGPGTGWQYSNTNYVLAGLVIEAVTGRSWEREVRSRILRPLRLTGTTAPGDDPRLPHPHARNYQQFGPGEPLTDTTPAYLPFDGDADGAMISTAADTNRFFTALLGGELLSPARLAEMRRTVPEPEEHGSPPGTRYGLGISWTPLSCGGGYWGHSGSGFGYLVAPAVTEGARPAALTVTAHSRPGDQETAELQNKGVGDLVDHALCTA